jgi:hypothetical protein
MLLPSSSMPRRTSFSAALRAAPIAVGFALTLTCMMLDFWRDPPDASQHGTAAYGHNGDGSLATGIILLMIETAVLCAILRPWSYRRSWGRALSALVLSSFWAVLWVPLTMHTGGVLMAHFLWLVAVLMGLVVAVLVSGVAAVRRRR